MWRWAHYTRQGSDEVAKGARHDTWLNRLVAAPCGDGVELDSHQGNPAGVQP
jgi:hypothetical protein